MINPTRGIRASAGVIFISAAIIFCACSSNAARNIKDANAGSMGKSLTDYSGTYISSDKKACDLVITVTGNNSGYSYSIKGAGIKSSGKLKIVADNEETYLVFTGTMRSGDKTAVEGVCSDKKIVIQNYGNAMNRYVCFKKCDLKYIELVKAE